MERALATPLAPGRSLPVSAAFLDVRDLTMSYGSRKALSGISFHINSGECYGLLGPNGAGKTTTILAICGLVKADSGQIKIGPNGQDPSNAEARRRIGYVPQDIALYDDLTGAENLRFFGRLYGLPKKSLSGRVDEVLELVDLRSRANGKVAAYSGGMKRRLNIAAALLHEPGLLILDEPTVGIDPQSRNSILEQLSALRTSGVALLYTSHYMEEVEQISDRIGIMDQGKILAEGTATSLLTTLGDSTARVVLSVGRPADADLLDSLRAVTGVISAASTIDGPELAVGDVARALPDVLATMAANGIQVLSLSVERPNLEAVFLHLTGKALRDG